MYNQNQLENLLKNERINDEKTIKKIKVYIENLKKWNNAINLTSEKSDIIGHIRDSLMFFELVKNPKGKLIDIGSGNGFPAIILAIVCPNLEVTMVESNAKKSAFLTDTVNKISLNAIIINKNVTEAKTHGRYDFATIRGLKCNNQIETALYYFLTDDVGKLLLWTYTAPLLKKFKYLNSVSKNNKHLHLYIKAQAAPQPI